MENIICNYCLQALRSRGEKVMIRPITFSDYDDIKVTTDDNGIEYCECCLCRENVESSEIIIANW